MSPLAVSSALAAPVSLKRHPAHRARVPSNRRVAVVATAHKRDPATAEGWTDAARRAVLDVAKAGVSALAAAAVAAGSVNAAGMDMSMGMDHDMSSMSNMMNPPGEPSGTHTSKAWQIWAYSAAGPKFIGEKATIVGADQSVLRKGTNGWTCLAGNPRPYPEGGWATPHDAMPLCADGEGMKWIQAYVTGEKPNLERDSIMYMLMGDMGEDNTTPLVLNKKDAKKGEWIESGRHLMLMPKDPASLAKFPTNFNKGDPYQMFAGTDYVHIMIPSGDDYFAYQAPKK